METLRFWVWHSAARRNEGGLVRLSLVDGDQITLVSGGACEEGYSWTEQTYSRDGEYVYLDVFTDGRDCDGRVSSAYTFRCKADRLAADWNRYTGQWMPDWEEVRSGQRDYAAESAGY